VRRPALGSVPGCSKQALTRSACWSPGLPRTAENAQRIAAGHVVFDEGFSRVLDIAASLMKTPIWSFWWD
jgi:hypothetical protein